MISPYFSPMIAMVPIYFYDKLYDFSDASALAVPLEELRFDTSRPSIGMKTKKLKMDACRCRLQLFRYRDGHCRSIHVHIQCGMLTMECKSVRPPCSPNYIDAWLHWLMQKYHVPAWILKFVSWTLQPWSYTDVLHPDAPPPFLWLLELRAFSISFIVRRPEGGAEIWLRFCVKDSPLQNNRTY